MTTEEYNKLKQLSSTNKISEYLYIGNEFYWAERDNITGIEVSDRFYVVFIPIQDIDVNKLSVRFIKNLNRDEWMKL